MAVLNAQPPARAAVLPIGERVFGPADQERFAALSGDCNPVHMPGRSAVRAIAAEPVVHGIHALLWSLERLFARDPEQGSVTMLRARFALPVLVGEPVSATRTRTGDDKVRLDLAADGKRAATIHLGFRGAVEPSPPARGVERPPPETPCRLQWDDLAACRGQLRPGATIASLASDFPAVVATLGETRLAGLCCMSTVVGMMCPGLHSLFGGLNLVAATAMSDDTLGYAVTAANEAFRLVSLTVAGCGWTGTLDTIFAPGAGKPIRTGI